MKYSRTRIFFYSIPSLLAHETEGEKKRGRKRGKREREPSPRRSIMAPSIIPSFPHPLAGRREKRRKKKRRKEKRKKRE